MFDDTHDRTASLMTPARLAQLKVRPAPAASPAAWLDQLAADAGSVHVRRLLDLRHQLSALLHGGELRAIVGGCAALAEALAEVDFSLVQPRGWLARMTGGGKEAAARFGAQHAEVLQAGQSLATEVRTLQKEQPAHRTAVERTLVECEVELRAIEKIMDQGARWLQDMRAQLKARRAETGEVAQQKAAEDEARCDLLVARLKLLRASTTAWQPVLQQGRAVCSARADLAARCAHVIDEEWQAWRKRAASVAEDAAAQGGAAEGVDFARQALAPLQAALRSAGEQARAVQAQDQALAGEVAALQGSLQAAA
jgi:hypothetical protein